MGMFALAKKAVDDELNGQSAPAEPSAHGNVPVHIGTGNGASNADRRPLCVKPLVFSAFSPSERCDHPRDLARPLPML